MILNLQKRVDRLKNLDGNLLEKVVEYLPNDTDVGSLSMVNKSRHGQLSNEMKLRRTREMARREAAIAWRRVLENNTWFAEYIPSGYMFNRSLSKITVTVFDRMRLQKRIITGTAPVLTFHDLSVIVEKALSDDNSVSVLAQTSDNNNTITALFQTEQFDTPQEYNENVARIETVVGKMRFDYGSNLNETRVSYATLDRDQHVSKGAIYSFDQHEFKTFDISFLFTYAFYWNFEIAYQAAAKSYGD